MLNRPLLAIDIGGGTQDILLYRPDQPLENCVQLTLPSPTVICGRRVEAATAARRDVFLTGHLMGGGYLVGALRRHLAAGCQAYATATAARTVYDDLERVRQLGIVITDRPPEDAELIKTGDVDLATLAGSLAPYGVKLPGEVAIAVLDHGEAPKGSSDRVFRFQHWQRFVTGGGRLADLLYREPPAYLTRMLAVREQAPGAWLMDTGAAALWGALEDARVAARREEGLIIVNCGNQHTIGVLVQGQRVLGLFEHHTSCLSGHKLAAFVAKLRSGELTNEEILNDGGHGCYIAPSYQPGDGFRFVAVTGPQRRLTIHEDYYWAAPHGNMMLSGCFGLIAAVAGVKINP
ncbi:DUF1786 domain-containing protein [Moorella naiadis]|uniref:DUF1786 domain-containing protein n=1 Tax=Moorella naiadis (nom. illeg.) TaxID=3093670 RepID=UPI003D9C94DD